jgi:hypothetical protein
MAFTRNSAAPFVRVTDSGSRQPRIGITDLVGNDPDLQIGTAT